MFFCNSLSKLRFPTIAHFNDFVNPFKKDWNLSSLFSFYHLASLSRLFFIALILPLDNDVQLRTPIAAWTASFSSLSSGYLSNKPNKISIAFLSSIFFKKGHASEEACPTGRNVSSFSEATSCLWQINHHLLFPIRFLWALKPCSRGYNSNSRKVIT